MKTQFTVAFVAIALTSGCGKSDVGPIPLRPSLELRTADGELYTPETLSLLRTHSWLEEVDEIHVEGDRWDLGTVRLENARGEGVDFLSVVNLPLPYLVPRLHYETPGEPDAFDGFNLMLAEYSRNGISVPLGLPGDAMAHYETDTEERVPWKLSADFEFEPNPYYRPLRFSVVNNCLTPGLWEVSAVDRSGEIYHAWFDMPGDFYHELVARTNQLPLDFIRKALPWHVDEVPLDLDRLRSVKTSLGSVPVDVMWDEEISFSTQDSRKRLFNDYVQFQDRDGWKRPEFLSDILRHPVVMSSFVEPGIYTNREGELNHLDFGFLGTASSAEISLVTPKTSYTWTEDRSLGGDDENERYIEIRIALADHEEVIIGNLPLYLLVRQEDFVLNGFGVGILEPRAFSERRQFLIEQGPRPSYAYLARETPEGLLGSNTHERGVEQIFIRSHPEAPEPYWEIIVASYERIVDLVKYRVTIPEALRTEQIAHSRNYIPPIFFTYRDDNVN